MEASRVRGIHTALPSTASTFPYPGDPEEADDDDGQALANECSRINVLCGLLLPTVPEDSEERYSCRVDFD